MMDLVMIVIFAWRLHSMAVEKGLSAWTWVSRFVSGYFLFAVAMSLGIVWYYGKDTFSNLESIQKIILPFTPFFLLFLVVWFIFLRSRILKAVFIADDQENDNKIEEDTSPKEPKKDLSYFR